MFNRFSPDIASMSEETTKTIKRRKPHDEFFKTTFSNPRIAKAYMRKFLPRPVLEQLDLDKLELANSSYISKQLRPYFSDIVYTCPYGSSKIVLSFLFEHKSQPVPYLHIQILRYILEVWKNNLRRKQELQVVVPLLFYHGQESWEYRPMQEYFRGVDASLERYVPIFDFEFLNIGAWTDEQIIALEEAFLMNALLVFKHIWNEAYIEQNINRFFIALEDRIQDGEGVNFIQAIFVYLVRSSIFENVNLKAMIDSIQDSFKEPVMTAYDRLIREGLERGLESGKKQGMQEGDAQRVKIALKNMHEEGLELPAVAKWLGIELDHARKILSELKAEGVIR